MQDFTLVDLVLRRYRLRQGAKGVAIASDQR
jgi:hypothetical protein